MKPVKPCTLISTVGTSLFSNLEHMIENSQKLNRNVMAIGPENLEWSVIDEITRHYKLPNCKSLGRSLTKVPGDARLCGAEINSIYALAKKGQLNIWQIIFFVSDTEAGKHTGEVLTAYFESCKDKLGLQNVKYCCIKNLQDKCPRDFRTLGLRNLVREVGKVVQSVGDPSLVAIDATGGYKAQIAVAALIGVALDIDVYYRHDKFGEIISFPPLPVTLDYGLIGRHGRLLHAFENGEILAEDEIGSIDEELQVLLDQEEIDGKTYWALSPIGEIILTGFRLRYPRPVNLPDASKEERKEPTFPDHHYPKGFKDYVKNIWYKTPWITRCVAEDYSGQGSMTKNGFHLREEPGDNHSNFVIIGTYVDNNGFAARFKVLTTGTRHDDLVWAVVQLNQKFAS